jgi:hypothetical protein
MAGWEFVGVVGVDSGTLMVTDPCYIASEWGQNTGASSYSLEGCWSATDNDGGAGQLNYNNGNPGAGVAWLSGWGDGEYTVEVKRARGRIVECRIVTR